MDEPLLWLGTLACAAAAALGLLPLPRRVRLAGLVAALLLAPLLVGSDSWDSPRLADLRESPALLAAALLAAAALLTGAALVLRRHPLLLAPALIAALPFRIPVDLGGEDANLLLPLYAVIAAGVLAEVLTARRDPARPAGWLRYTGPALAAVVVVYAVQAAWAADLTPALRNVAFFLAPFAALFFLLSRVRWDAAALRAVVVVLVVEGLAFALVAGAQYVTGELFWNDKVISGNEAHPYFRVNSLFWDPNILGRYLAVTMTALAGLVAFAPQRRRALAAAGVFAVLLVGLLPAFSQTSLLALLAGLLVLAAARWGIAAGLAAGVATIVALAASLVLLAGGGLSSETTSGRSGLIDGGLEIAADHPIAGSGSGSFPIEFSDRFGAAEGFAVESHTEPVTIAAEQGLLGLLAYGALLVVTIGGLLGACRLAPGRHCRGAPLAAALLAIYGVMVVHSFGYAAFLADPITWAVLALAAGALVPAPEGARPEASQTPVPRPV